MTLTLPLIYGQSLVGFENQWLNFTIQYQKNFKTFEDELSSFSNFAKNLNYINEHNSNKSATYKMKPNNFTDLSWEQFRNTYLMRYDLINPMLNMAKDNTSVKGNVSLPESVDWRSSLQNGAVRNQGGCGSCWAFAAITSLDSAYFIATNTSRAIHPGPIFSTQQIVSCSSPNGCGGGSSPSALSYAAYTNITTEQAYQYTATSSRCYSAIFTDPKANVARSTGYRSIQSQNEGAMMTAVATQPIVVYFQVSKDFQGYYSGVYRSSTCTTSVNHAMTIVGYSTKTAEGDYWIVQNSWGTGWGEDGYVKIGMTGKGDGPCGMYNYVYQPSLKWVKYLNGYTPPQAPLQPPTPPPHPPKPSPRPPRPSSPPPPRPRAPWQYNPPRPPPFPLTNYITTKVDMGISDDYLKTTLCPSMVYALQQILVNLQIVQSCILTRSSVNKYYTVYFNADTSGFSRSYFGESNDEFTANARLPCSATFKVHIDKYYLTYRAGRTCA